MFRKTLSGLAAGASLLLFASPAEAQEYYLGQVILVGYQFCPVGTAEADGRLLSRQSNPALFSVYGNAYGGDEDNFALPDLRGRTPVNMGQGPGLHDYVRGKYAGAAEVALSPYNMPAHAHVGFVLAAAAGPNVESPAGAALPDFVSGQLVYDNQHAPDSSMAPYTAVMDAPPATVTPLQIRSPVLTLRYCVVVNGVFPPN